LRIFKIFKNTNSAVSETEGVLDGTGLLFPIPDFTTPIMLIFGRKKSRGNI